MSQNFNAFHRAWNPFPEYLSNSWEYYKHAIKILQSRGAHFITMSEAYSNQFDPENINIILDHHIDHYPVEMEVMTRWELEQGIISSIYLFAQVSSSHLHQKINQWSVEDLNIEHYKTLEKAGFEIGYHHNAVGRAVLEKQGQNYDFSRTTEARKLDATVQARASELFKQDVEHLRQYFNIKTFIPHGGGEGNAFLYEAQTICENLIWAYNNRPSNEPNWDNFTDSSGLDAKIFKTNDAQIVATREALLAKAMTAEPGLHHLLLHPGRFSQGMPIESYYKDADQLPKNRPVQVPTTYPADATYLPLKIANLVQQWSSPLNEDYNHLKSKYTQLNSSDYTRVLTDSLSFLRQCMATTENCIGYFFHYNKLDKQTKYRLQRKDKSHKGENRQYLSFPIFNQILPDESKEIEQLFKEEFLFAYNQIFSNRPWKFLVKNHFKFGIIHLENIKLESQKDVNHLIKVLKQTKKQNEELKITLCSQHSSIQLKEIKKQLEKLDNLKYSIEKSPIWKFNSWWKINIELYTFNSKKDDPFIFQQLDLPKSKLIDRYFFAIPYSKKTVQSINHSQLKRLSSKQVSVSLAGQEPITYNLDSYLALSHQLFCRPIKQDPLKEFSNLCLSHQILKEVNKALFSNYEYHPFGNLAYRQLIQAPPESELLYQYLKQSMFQSLATASKNKSKRAQVLAWKWSYAARSSLEAYIRLNEPRFLALILDSYDLIRHWRDSSENIIDECRGKVCPAWGSDFYDQYAEMKDYDLPKEERKPRWTCTSATAGRITFPVVAASLIALSRDDQSRSEEEFYTIFQEVAETLRIFVADLKKLDQNRSAMWREDRGCYEPLNHQNAWAEAALVTSKALGNDKELHNSATQVMSAFKCELMIDSSNAYIWPYRGQYDQAIRKRSHEVEDIGHAHINLVTVNTFYQYGYLFNKEDMERFCNTFLHHVYKGRYSFNPRVSSNVPPEINVMKPHYADHFLGWSILGRYHQEILNIIEETIAIRYDNYPDNWFSSLISSYAYACRFESV